MGKKLFFDGDLFLINEMVVNILNFCQENPSVDLVQKSFGNEAELKDLLNYGVIFINNNFFQISDSVKIFDEDYNVLTAITYYFGLQCNLNCAHCHSRILAKDSRESLSEEKNRQLVSKIIATDPLSVRLGGGEPLMRNDFISTLQRFSEAGITTSFTTNGYFMNMETGKALSQIKKFEVARLSIHGFNQDHDSFTGVPGSFKKLIGAQKIFKHFNIPHKLVVVVCSQTKNKIIDFIDLAEQIGSDGILFRAIKIAGNASLEQMPNSEDWKKIYQTIEQEKKRRKIKISFAPAGPQVAKIIGINDKCLCGINTLTIRPSGDFSACGITFKTIGNIFETDLKTAWQSHPDFLSIRQGLCPCEQK